MKKEMPVNKLEFGMYISELDRPWEGTPFRFQGFVLSNRKQLDALQKYCKKVFIDPEKTVVMEEPVEPVKAKPPSVLTTIKEKTTYEEKAPVAVEMPVARAATRKTAAVLQDMFTSVQAGKALDAPRVKEAVTSMTDSVVRNPDAMMLLARMKEKSVHSLDRALGVSIYMITFGRFLHLPREQLDLLGMLGLLQDVGKMKLPAGLLDKKGHLTEEELDMCKEHVMHSVAILKGTHGLPPELPGLAALHHERYDGSGYPRGLRANQIGLFGGIAGLVDCFDAMTQPKPYGEAVAPSNALDMLYKSRDVHFDGPLVEQFIQCIGIYPVGALVELYTGEIGIVIAQNHSMRLMPRVMAALDSHKQPIKPPKIIDRAKIKRTLEKGSVPLDPSEFFLG
jgi:HD-GYP domain-containing protein (c-di-GMP phosphodiesterase class II)